MSVQLRLRIARIILAYVVGFVYISFEQASVGVLVLVLSGVILAANNPTVGGALKGAYFFFKSVIFCFIACMVWLSLFKDQAIFNLIGMSLIVCIGVYYFVDKPDFLVGFTFVALAPFFFINNGNLYTGTMAALNSIIGIVLVVIVVFFFYPQYARRQFLKKIQQTLSTLQSLVEDLSSGKNDSAATNRRVAYEEKFLREITPFYQCLDEIKIETYPHASYASECGKVLLRLRRLYRLFYAVVDLFGEQNIIASSACALQLKKVQDKLSEIQKSLNQVDQKYLVCVMPESREGVTTVVSLRRPRVNLPAFMELLLQETGSIHREIIQVILLGRQYHYF